MITTVLKNSSLYSLSGILLRASSIFLFPIFSAHLTKADYGILMVVEAIVLVLGKVEGLQLEKAIVRFLYGTGETDPVHRRTVVGNVWMSHVLSNVFWSGLILLVGPYVLRPVLGDIPFHPYLFYAVIGKFFSTLVYLQISYLKGMHHGTAAFRMDLGFNLTNIVLNLVFVVAVGMDVLGLIYSTIASSVLFVVISVPSLWRNARFRWSWSIQRQMLRFAVSLLPFALLGILLGNVDKLILNSFKGSEVSGIYYIAVTFAGAFSMMKEAIVAAVTPWYYQHRDSARDLIGRFFTDLILGLFLVGAIASMFSYEGLRIISSNPDFVDAWMFIPTLVAGFGITFIGQLYTIPVLHGKRRVSFLAIGNLVGLIGNTSLAFLLVGSLGIHGATIAKVVGFLLMTVAFMVISRRSGSLPLRMGRIAVVCSLLIAAGYLNYLPVDPAVRLSIKLAFSATATLFFGRRLITKYVFIRRRVVGMRSGWRRMVRR